MITGNKVRIRSKRLSDAHNDYKWQTDPELAQLDATTTLNVSFAEYMMDFVYLLRHPPATSYHFAIETLEGIHIGSCTYYNIDPDKGEAELGIMLGERDYWCKGYGTDAVNTLLDHIFQQTDLNRIYLKTLDWNARAQVSFKKCGFIPCEKFIRDGYNFLQMEMTRPQWQALRTGKNGEEIKLHADRMAG